MAFSNRTKWNLNENSIITLERSLRAQNVEILNLTQSNPTYCGFSYLNHEILNPLLSTENLKYFPSPRGHQIAREVIVNYYRQNNAVVELNRIFLTASTSEAYFFLFKLLLNPNEGILVPRPGYPLFNFLADLGDLKIAYYRLTYTDRWEIDFESLEKNITPATRTILLVHPNNPTGSFLTPKEIGQLMWICKSRNLSLICDEVFLDYGIDLNKASAGTLAAIPSDVLVFVLSGISKVLGLPQMKLAWIIVSGPEQLTLAACERLDVIADTFLSVNTPVQNALPAWFQKQGEIQSEIRRRLLSNHRYLTETFQDSKALKVLKTEGGWYAILKTRDSCNEEKTALELLERCHVLTHPGYFFDFEEEGIFVVSLLPEEKIFREGISRVHNFFLRERPSK